MLHLRISNLFRGDKKAVTHGSGLVFGNNPIRKSRKLQDSQRSPREKEDQEREALELATEYQILAPFEDSFLEEAR
jgi:hypothetical protein